MSEQANDYKDPDFITVPLSSDVTLSLWSSLYNVADEPIYIWAQFNTNEFPQVWYKCFSENEEPLTDWKAFQTFKDICNEVEADEDAPQLGTTEKFDVGSYIVQTKVAYKGKTIEPPALAIVVEPKPVEDEQSPEQKNESGEDFLGDMIEFIKESGEYADDYLQEFHEEMKQAYCTIHPCKVLQEQLDKKENTPFEESVEQLFLAFMKKNYVTEDLENFAQTVQTEHIPSILNKVITIGGPQDYMDEYNDSNPFFAFIDFVSAIVISFGDAAIATLNEFEDSKINTHYIHYIKKFVNDKRFHADLLKQFPFLNQ